VNRIAVAIVAVAMTGALGAVPAAGQMPGGGRSQSGSSGASHLPPMKSAADSRAADAPVGLIAQVQQNLDRTADELRITAGQQKAWDAYATRVVRLADDIARTRYTIRDVQSGNLTAPQLFDRITETAQNRLTAIEDIAEAGRALYDRLTPDQKQMADRRLAAIALSLASGVAPSTGGRDDAAPPKRP
jgi:hypothetical protein